MALCRARLRPAVVGRVGEPGVDEVDELREHAPLLVAVVRPERAEARPAVAELGDAEEVLEPTLGLPERIALDVEEEVAARGPGQEREAAVGLGRERLPAVELREPVLELERRLLAELLERDAGQPRHVGAGFGGSELGKRRDPGAGEPRDLVAPDPGDPDEVVAPVLPRLAELAEVADAAVVARVRLGLARVLDGVEEAVADAPVVGEEVVGAVALAHAGAELDVEPLRHAPDDAAHLLGVEAELEHVRRLPVPRELRVDDFVGAVPLADDEVREPAPVAVDEAGLVDDVGAGAERLLGLARRTLPVPVGVGELDLDDVTPLVAEPLEVAGSYSSPSRLIRSPCGSSGRGRPSPPRATWSSSCVRCSQAR